MSSIRQYLDERTAVIDAALERAVAADGSQLVEAMRYTLFAGGKRIRPILLLAMGEALGAAPPALLPFACGLEMIHVYSLIHDDLPAMDDDDMRRGQPSNHVRFGDALAILAGDALQAEAFAMMAQAAQESPAPARAARALAEIAAAAGSRGMVGGQADDIAAAGGDADLAFVESVHRRKTGALLCASVRAGAILAAAGDVEVAAVTRYGEALGLAFQVVDDVLDATAPAAVTGKIGGGDRAGKKRTYVELLGVDAARQRAAALRDEAAAALEPLADKGQRLCEIADLVVERATSGSAGG